jgi:hypothetical protein
MKTILVAAFGVALTLPIFALAGFGNYGEGYGMMGYGTNMGGFGFFMAAGGIVWTIVGILAAVWLWQQINRK